MVELLQLLQRLTSTDMICQVEGLQLSPDMQVLLQEMAEISAAICCPKDPVSDSRNGSRRAPTKSFDPTVRCSCSWYFHHCSSMFHGKFKATGCCYFESSKLPEVVQQRSRNLVNRLNDVFLERPSVVQDRKHIEIWLKYVLHCSIWNHSSWL